MVLTELGHLGAQFSFKHRPAIRSCCTLSSLDIPVLAIMLSSCRKSAMLLSFQISTCSVMKYTVAGTQICYVRSSLIKIWTRFQIGIRNREPQPDDTVGCVWTRCFRKSYAGTWRCFEGLLVYFTIQIALEMRSSELFFFLSQVSLWYIRQSPLCYGNWRENTYSLHLLEVSPFSCVYAGASYICTAKPDPYL